MSGARVTIGVDDADVRAMLGRIADFGEAPPRAMFADMGEALVISTRDRAARQVDPDGVPWLDLSPKYQAYKDKKRPGVPILKFDFHMLGDQFGYQVGDTFLDVGTNAIYGAIQQLGGRGIPAREYLGISDDDADLLAEILGDHLQAVIDAD